MTSPVNAPWWHPDRFARRKPYLALRQRVITAARQYFASEDFAEVETPVLQVSPGNEVHLQTFKTELKEPYGARQTLYLHTSPELTMKKLLVAGMPRIFQLSHCFRNGERSALHHPEFLMCEWYRVHADISVLMQDCVKLVRAAADISGCKNFARDGVKCDPFRDWQKLSVADAFQQFCGIDLLASAPDPRQPTAKLLFEDAKRLGIRLASDDSWEDIFFRIMADKIEPRLGREIPTFLYDYPISLAALARPKAEDTRLAERFELYICGIELANGFGELTDADEQVRRFQADMELREKLYGERLPVDLDFIAALRYGMPECAGLAFGIDRLIMLCAGLEKIDDVLWAPVANTDR